MLSIAYKRGCAAGEVAYCVRFNQPFVIGCVLLLVEFH